MDNFQVPIVLGGDVPEERQTRRDEWTLGRPVQLADGESWWLPQVDWTLLVFHPDLLTTITRTFDMADRVWRTDLDAKRHMMATAIYHTQLAQLGVELLRCNYNLSDDRWRRLVSFEHLEAMLCLTLAVSEAVATSIPAWMPFYLTSGADGTTNLLLN